MNKQDEGSSLIEQLEEEMLNTLKGLEAEETEIKVKDVYDWYLESEKILRIVANITLNNSSKQAVNQLRYAGHHLLKREIAEEDTEKQANLVEAYKHCKRAYYDTLDLYVLDISHTFTIKLDILPDSEEKTEIRKKIYTFIKKIPEARFTNKTRRAYYSFIREGLVEGLQLLNKVNLLIDSKTEFSQEILTSKEVLIGKNQQLEANIKNLEQRYESKLAKLLYWLAWTIPLFAAVSMLFQGALTDYFRTPVVNIEHSIKPQIPIAANIKHALDANQFPTHPIGKK